MFLFFVEHLNVLGEEHVEQPPSPYLKPVFDPVRRVQVDRSLRETPTRRTLLLIGVAAVTVGLLPAAVTAGQALSPTPVKAALGWTLLRIDGNRNKNGVDFDHLDYQRRLKETIGDEDVCLTCHHLSKPQDEVTSCWECHRDMFLATSIFDHPFHQQELGGNLSCGECHQGERTASTAKACVECHQTMLPPAGKTTFSYIAPSYEEALHGRCLSCHE